MHEESYSWLRTGGGSHSPGQRVVSSPGAPGGATLNKALQELTSMVGKQGTRKFKIGWELTKSGCHVQSPE